MYTLYNLCILARKNKQQIPSSICVKILTLEERHARYVLAI